MLVFSNTNAAQSLSSNEYIRNLVMGCAAGAKIHTNIDLIDFAVNFLKDRKKQELSSLEGSTVLIDKMEPDDRVEVYQIYTKCLTDLGKLLISLDKITKDQSICIGDNGLEPQDEIDDLVSTGEEAIQLQLELLEKLYPQILGQHKYKSMAKSYLTLGYISKKRGDFNKTRRNWIKAMELYEKAFMHCMVKKIKSELYKLR
jgi:tetratricopeptide (TPR) repeat protein